MNIPGSRPDAHGLYNSSFAVNVDETIKKGSEQGTASGLFAKRRIGHEPGAVAKKTEFGCIVPGCSHQMAAQTVHGRNVSQVTTTAGSEIVDVARGRVNKTFTVQEVAERFRNTMENLITSCSYGEITRRSNGDDQRDVQRDEVIEIFIDFILCQEGLVNDRGFIVANSPDKYVAGKTISQVRVKEIQSFLNDMFTERAAKKSRFTRTLSYSLGEMLADYLNKKENVPDDVNPKVDSDSFGFTFTYKQLLPDIFPFFETLFAEKGLFSEWGVVFNFAMKFRQELIDSCSVYYRARNILTMGLRTNKSDMREYFNRHVMDVIFPGRCDGIVNTLFDGCSLPTDREAKPVNRLNLKFGEELEYDVLDQSPSSYSWRRLVTIFTSRLEEKGITHCDTSTEFARHYGLNESFTVKPFYDTKQWVEINCTPYHSDDKRAEFVFEKVIEVINSMRNDGFIGYSSGHKHVDVLSATQGDTGVLLAMECEIQRNPFLLRAFGNNDRIVQRNEFVWYKTFADYNPDAKPFAVNRLNLIIDRYNRKIKENYSEKLGSEGETDLEKRDRLKQFAHFYSQFVHMTTIQKGQSFPITEDRIEKYMAMSLLHITGASTVTELSTLEFRFFRCPKTVREIQLINQFLQAWFQYVHQCRMNKTPLEYIPEDIQSCKDYTAEEVRNNTISYLKKLDLNPDEYRCFWGEVQEIPSEPVPKKYRKRPATDGSDAALPPRKVAKKQSPLFI